MPARRSGEFSTHRDILSNALDFLLHSLRPPVADSEEEPGDILPKYLVLNLAAAVELIFKARLCKEHWSLIFQKLDKASSEALQSGDFCSVTFDDCVERFTRICGISFSASAREVLCKLRSQRNIYQHLRFEAQPEAKLLFAAQCLDLVLDQLDTWFEPDDFDENAQEARNALRSRLSNFHELSHVRLSRLSNQVESLRNSGRLAHCPMCGKVTLELQPVDKCLFCHWSAPASEVASMVAADENGRREASRHQLSLFPLPPLPHVHVARCKKCGLSTMLVRVIVEENRIDSSVCYSCGNKESPVGLGVGGG